MPVPYLFIDTNAYFASCEQHLRPELRGRPVAVIPVLAETTACIAASYEAKPFGIRTGTSVADARRLCPKLLFVQARPQLYVDLHHQIIDAVQTVLPVDAIASIDEMVIKLLGVEKQRDQAIELAKRIKRAIATQIGPTLRCSIGLGPNRMIAKMAADMQKPDGLTVIEREELPDRLFSLKLEDFPGIGPRMHRRLLKAGIANVQQMFQCTITQLSEVWCSKLLGEAWWRKIRGEDLPESHTRRRMMGHSHVLPPHLRNRAGAKAVLMRLIDKAAARMRHAGYWAGSFSMSLSYRYGQHWDHRVTIELCQDTTRLMTLGLEMWRKSPQGGPVKVGIVLGDLVHQRNVAPSLFDEDGRRLALSVALDRIRGCFGPEALYFADMRDAMDEVKNPIAFSHIPNVSIPGVA